MFKKISTVIKSVRINKKYDDFIKDFVNGFESNNQNDFMRKAIEIMAEASMVRVTHPAGYASIEEFNNWGVVRYWYGYDMDEQFIVVRDIHGVSFGINYLEYTRKIKDLLKIQAFEDIKIYFIHYIDPSKKYNTVVQIGHDGEFMDVSDKQQKFIEEFIDTLDLNTMNFVLSRRGYFRKILQNAVLDWDENAENITQRLRKATVFVNRT